MHMPHILVNDLEREVLFVLEMMVERTLRSTRGVEQGLDAQIVVAMLQEHGHPRIEQTLLGYVLGVQCDRVTSLRERTGSRKLNSDTNANAASRMPTLVSLECPRRRSPLDQLFTFS